MNILKKDSFHYFIVDTGADISLLKKDCIRSDILCNPRDRIKIQGINKDCIETLASTHSKIFFPNIKTVDHKFHIVGDNFNLNCSGILGIDFLQNFKSIVDYDSGILELNLGDSRIFIDLCSSPDDIIKNNAT